MRKATIKATKKAKTVSKNKTKYGCDEVEKYLDSAVNKVKSEILPKIDILDKRDKDQYDAAKKIIVDAHSLMGKKQEHIENVVDSMRSDFKNIVSTQDTVVKELSTSLKSINSKLDAHIIHQNSRFDDIQETLFDISLHGTALAKQLQEQLNHVAVNGGVYPLNEAMKHVYNQHTMTHQKLDEVVALVEPIRARKRWMKSTKELLQKNGLLHFIFQTKFGIVLTTIVALLFFNTILVDVFKINLDLLSIFSWIAKIFKGAS